MKKQVCSLFAALLVLGLCVGTSDALAMEESVGELLSKVHLSGLIEVGAAWQDVEFADGESEDASDLTLTTVELALEAEVNEWVNVGALFLYEDPTSFEGENDETSVDLDEAVVTIGNTEEYPLYCSAGAMYVPFGGLLTHFPDDPLIDQPLTLLMGETREKAVLLGMEHEGFSVSGYLFNGDVNEEGEDNQIESFGFDANYAYDDEEGFDVLAGASYISNIADSDGLEDGLGIEEIADYVAGYDVYLHVGWADFFVEAEYMAAADDFEPSELATEDGDGAEPSVWNLELGYNWDWGKNLEIVVKYAGSDESEGLGFPEKRYGLCFNQDIYEGVIVSLAYLNDDFEDADVDGRDDRDVVYGQIAIEF
jgi:hypothetical protein